MVGALEWYEVNVLDILGKNFFVKLTRCVNVLDVGCDRREKPSSARCLS